MLIVSYISSSIIWVVEIVKTIIFKRDGFKLIISNCSFEISTQVKISRPYSPGKRILFVSHFSLVALKTRNHMLQLNTWCAWSKCTSSSAKSCIHFIMACSQDEGNRLPSCKFVCLQNSSSTKLSKAKNKMRFSFRLLVTVYGKYTHRNDFIESILPNILPFTKDVNLNTHTECTTTSMILIDPLD